MNYETNRLNTFSNWPSSAPVDPIRIAKAGFYYTGQAMEVQCFSCNGKISEWNYGDQVMWRHRRLAPSCPFVVNSQLSGNVPLVVGAGCPSNEETATSWSSPDEQNDLVETSSDYGVTEEDRMYRSDPLRLLSFSDWEDQSVSRESLVAAGFYHAGSGRLRCAWCGGELAPFRRFGTLGPPLEVHRMYFPRCEHASFLETMQQPPSSAEQNSTPETPPVQTPPETTVTDSNQSQSTGAAHNERLLDMGGTWRSLGVVSGGARYPQYASLTSRLATFDNWPSDRLQTPRDLSEAGFFHTGTDDQVRCFYCDGGLGRWEAGDAPWREHARWFPHCGYVLLLRGHEFVDACAPTNDANPTETTVTSSRRRNTGVNFPVSENQIDESMESPVALAALGAGLDAARVRRAITQRLRSTGTSFQTSESLIDAVLDAQLNEEAWSTSTQPQNLARNLLAETLRDIMPNPGVALSLWDDNLDSGRSRASSPPRTSPARPPPVSPSSPPVPGPITPPTITTTRSQDTNDSSLISSPNKEIKKLTLEEENRQLKEARMCKVCMDSEVSVVFLPCGHLVSCARCGAALHACPLCRAAVRALVRAYLA